MKGENKRSEREGADRGRPGRTERVSGIEKVGGKSGVRFPVHNHPDHSRVDAPKGKMDR